MEPESSLPYSQVPAITTTIIIIIIIIIPRSSLDLYDVLALLRYYATWIGG